MKKVLSLIATFILLLAVASASAESIDFSSMSEEQLRDLRQQIDLELAKEALKDLIGAVNRQITVENIQKTVAEYYKIKVADLFSSKRTRQIVRPRQVAMWLAKNLTSQSYPSIGEAFGGRDHTTVLHAVRTIESLRGRDIELNHDVHVLQQVLKG